MQLAERCGPWFADALSGVVAYQELLFPGGSMEAVLPVYEDAVSAAFYNGCVVAVVDAILLLLPKGRDVEVELTETSKSWNMRVQRHPSLSDPDGRILQIEGLSRVECD